MFFNLQLVQKDSSFWEEIQLLCNQVNDVYTKLPLGEEADFLSHGKTVNLQKCKSNARSWKFSTDTNNTEVSTGDIINNKQTAISENCGK